LPCPVFQSFINRLRLPIRNPPRVRECSYSPRQNAVIKCIAVCVSWHCCLFYTSLHIELLRLMRTVR
jgi:hypothetical protein